MNLVIQSLKPLEPNHHQPLLALARGAQLNPINAYALRITGADLAQRPHIEAYCQANALDCAFIAAGQSWSDYGLLAMDMDSTLIAIECIDEIAHYSGLKDQVSAITAAAMHGEIKHFDASLEARVALLKGLDAHVLERVYEERLQLSPGAEAMLAGVRQAQLRTLLVSGGFTFFTERLKARLNLDFAYANTLEIMDGKLTGKIRGAIVNAHAKARIVREVCAKLSISPAQTIAIGDGSNDLDMMAIAGLSVAFHAKPIVRQAAQVAFNHVGLDGLLRLF